jgi:hypothetical protein
MASGLLFLQSRFHWVAIVLFAAALAAASHSPAVRAEEPGASAATEPKIPEAKPSTVNGKALSSPAQQPDIKEPLSGSAQSDAKVGNSSAQASSDATQSDAKPAEASSESSKVNGTSPERQPSTTTAAKPEAGPSPDTAPVADAKTVPQAADAIPNTVPAAEDKARTKPAAETKPEPKAADAKPETKPSVEPQPETRQGGEKLSTQKPADQKAQAVKPSEQKPGEAKEAKGENKPKDLAARTDNGDELAVHASSVNAVYEIHFLGAHIGDFRIRSAVTNRQYSLQANADVSIFFGTVSWQGVTSSHGLMTANGPMPQSYNFRYATNDRREAIELRFQQHMVQDIIINPPAHSGMRTVPITAAHLQNVVDPLSAVVLLSQARLNRHNADPCNKRLPIFDGKTRYDLVLSMKGTRPINSTGKLRGPAYVCSVNYVPIAGHKPGKQGETDYATGNTGIEVWLVPVPEAGLLVPYYVHVPTPAGTASMVTAKFDIDTAAGRHALAE